MAHLFVEIWSSFYSFELLESMTCLNLSTVAKKNEGLLRMSSMGRSCPWSSGSVSLRSAVRRELDTSSSVYGNCCPFSGSLIQSRSSSGRILHSRQATAYSNRCRLPRRFEISSECAVILRIQFRAIMLPCRSVGSRSPFCNTSRLPFFGTICATLSLVWVPYFT
jgi:hypothetical protein